MPADRASHLAENLILFCRTLRRAGLAIGPGQVVDAGQAVLGAGIERRDDFYYALRAVLVRDPAQFRLFNQAFHVYFRNPRLLEQMMGLLLPPPQERAASDPPEMAVRRLLEALWEPVVQEREESKVEIDRSGSCSSEEMLRQKDFEQMNLEELAAARQLLRQKLAIARQVPTRRLRTSQRGRRYDLKKSMRLMLRNNGQLVELARKKRRLRPPNLVLICDISGSMSGYSRMFLHFAHTLGCRGQRIHSFVFGTRLTNVSHWLAEADVDRALARVAAEVRDWDGGTRIAGSLRSFNRDWGRRVLSGHSAVLLLSDGLERDVQSDLAVQMDRLQRSTDLLIWLNPLLRYEQFEARAAGIKTMLEHVDRFVPAHNVDSLADLARLLADIRQRRDRRAA